MAWQVQGQEGLASMFHLCHDLELRAREHGVAVMSKRRAFPFSCHRSLDVSYGGTGGSVSVSHLHKKRVVTKEKPCGL